MPKVKCPQCETVREVSARKPWMKGDEPYLKICKSCCQVGKSKTEEHKRKLSESLIAIHTEEYRKKKSEYWKQHPELWQNNLVAGQGSGWNKGLELPTRNDETKEKISNSMKKYQQTKNDVEKEERNES